MVDSIALQQVAAQVPFGTRWAAYQSAARALTRLPRETIPEALQVRVAVLGSFTLEPFLSVLRVEGARVGLWLDPYLAPYGQYLPELLDSESGLYRFRPHVTFVAIDSDVLWNQRWVETPLLSSEQVVSGLLTPLFAGFDTFDRAGSGVLVVNDFVLPRRSTEGVNAFRKKGTFAHTIAHANKHLRLRLAAREQTFLFPLADVVAQVGRTHAFQWPTHYRGHLTWSDTLMATVARRYAGFALAALGKATKCIVLDLDNTLWGGVLGEEGPAGIAIGPHWPGQEFLDFQRELLELQRQGILLAIASKNNEGEVLAVLREHPHMLIREQHLAAWRINWEDKATSIRSIAEELNIGLDHMLLIDDSPHERAWVHDQIPQLLVPEVPAEPSLYADWLGSLPSLLVLRQTAEDSRRTQHYQETRDREAYRSSAGTVEDFLRGLDLRVRIDQVNDETMGRVVQLLAKTNQFNLTTRRHDEATVRRQVAAQAWRVYTMHVADRFGDFGLTGLAIAACEPEVWHLDSFLLSCRVIGKSVETALLAHIAADARAHGATGLSAEFIDSGRNQVAAAFLGNHSFQVGADGQAFRSLEVPGPTWPAWVADASRVPAEAAGAAAAGESR